jgi:hypothetical protein
MTMMEARVSQNPLAQYGRLIAVCLVAGGIAGAVSAAFGETAGAGPLIVAGSVGLAMAAALWVCTRWWRSLDEAAQEAHKWAWWWGSLCDAGGADGCTQGSAFGRCRHHRPQSDDRLWHRLGLLVAAASVTS